MKQEDKESLLLTPEEIQNIYDETVRDNEETPADISEEFPKRVAFYQNYKDIHPPKLDKPDGDGLWFCKCDDGIERLIVINCTSWTAIAYKIRTSWFPCNIPRVFGFQGTWWRAIVPE